MLRRIIKTNWEKTAQSSLDRIADRQGKVFLLPAFEVANKIKLETAASNKYAVDSPNKKNNLEIFSNDNRYLVMWPLR